MKIISKLTLAALSAALLSATASADELKLVPVHGTFLFRSVKQPATVAVYANQRGTGRSANTTQDERSESRFELRSNAHGQTFGVYVPVQ